jgi:hypothetical protein
MADSFTSEEVEREMGLVEDLPIAPDPEALTRSDEGPDITLEKQFDPTLFQTLKFDQQKRMDLLADVTKSFTATGMELAFEATAIGKGARAGKFIAEKAAPQSGVAKFFGDVLGTAGGAGVGDQAAQGVARVPGLEGLLGPPPADFGSEESINRSLKDAGFAGGATGILKTLGAGISQATGISAIKNMTPDERSFARSILREVEKNPDLIIDPAIIAPRSKPFAIISNVIKGAITTSGGLAEGRQALSDVIFNNIKRKAMSLTQGKSVKEVGETVVDLARQKKAVYTDALSATAARIDLMSDAPIFINMQKGPAATARKLSKSRVFQKVMGRMVKETGVDISKVGQSTITLPQSQGILNFLSKEIGRLRRGKVSSIDDILADDLDKLRVKLLNQQVKQIKAFAVGKDKSFADDIKLFNKVQMDGPEKFTRDLLTEVIRSDPRAAGLLYRTIKSSNKIKALRAEFSTQEWRKVQGATIQDLFQTFPVDPQTGGVLVSGVEFLENLRKIPPDVRSAIFHPSVSENLERLGKMLVRTQAKPATSIGGVFMELTQAGAITSMLFRGIEGPPLSILVGPAVLNWIVSNKTASKLLLKAAADPKISTGEKSSVVTGLIGILTKEGLDFEVKEEEGGGGRAVDPFSEFGIQ